MPLHLASVLLRTHDNRLVLNRRRPDDSVAGGKIGLFGGHVEDGEEPEAAAHRELGEEVAGIGTIVLTHLGVFPLRASSTDGHEGGTVDIFAATLPPDAAPQSGEEGAEVAILSFDDAMQHPDLADGMRVFLPFLIDLVNQQREGA